MCVWTFSVVFYDHVLPRHLTCITTYAMSDLLPVSRAALEGKQGRIPARITGRPEPGQLELLSAHGKSAARSPQTCYRY